MTGMAGREGHVQAENGGGTDQKTALRVESAEDWCKSLKRVKDGETQYLVCYGRGTPNTAPNSPSVLPPFYGHLDT
jgi:hypothetical protein